MFLKYQCLFLIDCSVQINWVKKRKKNVCVIIEYVHIKSAHSNCFSCRTRVLWKTRGCFNELKCVLVDNKCFNEKMMEILQLKKFLM